MSRPEQVERRRAGKPRVAVIGTGGTISGVGRHSLDLYEYMETVTGDIPQIQRMFDEY